MQYQSTRNAALAVSSAQAITQGISEDGGLFVPREIPHLPMEELVRLSGCSYRERAVRVLSGFLTDFSAAEVEECVRDAYTDRFRSPTVAPLHRLSDSAYLLELWHGPTCAFKDMALQMLPHLMRVSAGKTSEGREIVILVATSGDTGKAALEGFRDAKGTRILVYYPETGVSEMQKRQMATQEGSNVAVFAIRGNFDDAQSGVKALFTSDAMRAKLAAARKMFSSANSINWGRLVPQIVYYVSAYCDLLAEGRLRPGEPMNAAVPTGNFGNILAAYYAREMGVPIARLICASNRNRVLTDFLASGTYDRNRDFYTTTSPSMDILISSNLERLLFHLSGGDDAAVKERMAELTEKGTYTVSAAVKERLDALFYAGCCDDAQTAETIAQVFRETGYVCDTHTAVGVHVYEQYVKETGDRTPTVIASTANPYKFPASVLKALGGQVSENEWENLEALHRLTGAEVPAPLAGLYDKPIRFTRVCDVAEMPRTVCEELGLSEG